MAFTENYAIFNDLPEFWDPDRLEHGQHVMRYFPELPSRFAIVPRRGHARDIRWFEAEPTYVLHWINAYEDGDEVVLDGFFQHAPWPARDGTSGAAAVYRFLDLNLLQSRPHRWRFNLATGVTKEEPLSDTVMEFGMISGRAAGQPYRYAYNMTSSSGAFVFDGMVKHDVVSGDEQRYRFGDGVFGSETPFAPRPGATAEDDGYLLSFTTDIGRDVSECLIFDATDITGGPLARVRLPERISSGTHAHWAPATALHRPAVRG
jgi:carotenoid cleavage dioxygenase-like enzyme